MNKLMVPFDTFAVNPAIDPSGAYAMRVAEQQILEDDAVYEEVIKEETLPLSVKLLKFSVNAVLNAVSKKTSQDCRPRRVGDEIKFVVALRGKLAGPYSSFDPDTCSAVVLAMPMKGCVKKVDLSRVHLYNSRTGLKVTIDRITYEGSTDAVGVIKVGKGIVVTGLNCQWLDGDSCTLAWKDAEGNPHTASITPTASSVTEMRFAWPTALDGVAAGTEVTFNFLTRGGIEDAESQPNAKTVTVIAGDEPTTTITKVTQDGRPDDTVLHNQTSQCVVHGTGLALGTGDKVLIELYRDGVCIDEGDLSANGKVVSSSDTAINLSGFYWNNRVPDGDWWDVYPDSKLIVIKNGVRYVHPLTFKGE